MRLIDADALKADLRESYDDLNKIYDGLEHHDDRQICGGQLATFLEAILRVKDAPTIDAVPVVRCKDCKHFRFEEFSICIHPVKGLVCPDPDDFCSYGERRDGAE